jgi:HSP20 family molecular chaperone IbpA
MRDLEARMDSVFARAFGNVGSWFDESTLASSVDLREQNDRYIARLYMPHADTGKVDAKIDNGALRITASGVRTVNGQTTKENYEQTIALPKAVEADKIKIDRKQDMVVITVPKTLSSAPNVASAPSPVPTTSPATTSTDWDDIMFNRFADMQRRMDEAVHDVFAGDRLNGASTSQLGSAVNVDDQKDKYVVHFYLPARDLTNVKVDFENGQLHLTAEEQKNATNKSSTGTVETSSSGRYEEMITLASPVKDKEMKMERKNGAVVVTLPKA